MYDTKQFVKFFAANMTVKPTHSFIMLANCIPAERTHYFWITEEII